MKAILERNLSFIGYPYYSVDTDGNVFSHKSNKYLTSVRTKDGYDFVNLCVNGKMHIYKKHRLVALAFIPNPDNKPCIDHINGDRTDNRVCNLRWCTCKENSNNPITRMRLSESKKGKSHPMFGILGKNNPKSKVVLQYTKDGEFVAEYYGVAEAQRLTNICRNNITACCRGKRKSAGGYIWAYKKEND